MLGALRKAVRLPGGSLGPGEGRRDYLRREGMEGGMMVVSRERPEDGRETRSAR